MEKDVALAIVQNDLEQLVALAEPTSQKVSLVFFFFGLCGAHRNVCQNRFGGWWLSFLKKKLN